jgi:hypothetical protein
MTFPPRLLTVATAFVAAALALAAARAVAPVVLSAPVVPTAAWVGWLAAASPWAGALGCGVAVWWHGLGRGWTDRRFPLAAAWACGAVGCVVLLSPLADATVLFPFAMPSDSWQAAGAGLVDVTHGVRVEPDGAIWIGAGSGVAVVTRPRAVQALVVVSSLTVWVPLTVAIPGPTAIKTAGLTLALVVAIVVAHAVGAGQMSSGWLAISALPLVVAAVALAWSHLPRDHASAASAAE